MRNGKKSRKRSLLVWDLGFLSYEKAYYLQQKIVKDVWQGDHDDTVLIMEHPPVITMGRSGCEEHILCERKFLEAQGIMVQKIDRGGGVTYHGPGQLIVYPILNLHRHIQDLHHVIHLYEDVIIQTLSLVWGIKGQREKAHRGVWLDKAKVASIGIGVTHWVTYHGFSINVNPKLENFCYIIPCGLNNKKVTSISRLLNRPVGIGEIIKPLAWVMADVFNLELEWREEKSLAQFP